MKLSARVQPLQKQELYLDHPNSPVHMNFLANLSFVKYTYFDRRKRNPAIHPNHRECMVFLVLFVSVFNFIFFIHPIFFFIYLLMVGKFIFLAFFSSQRIYVNRHHETFYLFLLGKTPRSLVQIIFSLFVYCQNRIQGCSE